METRRAATAALDLLHLGVIFTRADGTIVGANRSARRLLESGDVLAAGADGRLRTRDAGQAAALRRCLLDGLSASAALSLILDDGRSLTLLVRPLPAEAGAPESGLLAVFVCDPRVDLLAPADLLGGLYGLTPAEARLASALARGRTLEDAARQFRASRNTIRTHLKRIFAKTETRRQSDLVRLLVAGPAQLRVA
jgi:DNA-binding CsgD family transcriptional regulator